MCCFKSRNRILNVYIFWWFMIIFVYVNVFLWWFLIWLGWVKFWNVLNCWLERIFFGCFMLRIFWVYYNLVLEGFFEVFFKWSIIINRRFLIFFDVVFFIIIFYGWLLVIWFFILMIIWIICFIGFLL